MNIPVAILARVSTSKQETDRQLHELRNVACDNGWQVIAEINSIVSGAKGDDDRPDINQMLALAESGQIKKVLVHEVSRLGRRPGLVAPTVERLTAAGVSLYWHNQKLETLLPDGRRNQATGLILAIMSEFALAERETLIERINSGLDKAKRNGQKLGRPVGTTLSTDALLTKHADIVRGLRAEKSLRDVAARTGKGLATVKRVKKAMGGVA